MYILGVNPTDVWKDGEFATPGGAVPTDNVVGVQPGVRGIDDAGNEYVAVEAGTGGWAQYDALVRTGHGVARKMTSTLAKSGMLMGVGQATVAAGEFGWMLIMSQEATIATEGAIAVGVKIYTHATAGHVDDSTASGAKEIKGIVAPANIGAGADHGTFEMTYPHIA